MMSQNKFGSEIMYHYLLFGVEILKKKNHVLDIAHQINNGLHSLFVYINQI
jgi:hypothetical protein